MENVKFIEYKEFSREVDYCFKIHDNLADWIRKNTKFKGEALTFNLSEDNIIKYRISITNHEVFPEFHNRFIETVERICNEYDDSGFANNLITNNGHRRFPHEIHKMMHEKYGLADINEYEDNKESQYTDIDFNIEWYAAHFIIFFTILLFDTPLGFGGTNLK